MCIYSSFYLFFASVRYVTDVNRHFRKRYEMKILKRALVSPKNLMVGAKSYSILMLQIARKCTHHLKNIHQRKHIILYLNYYITLAITTVLIIHLLLSSNIRLNRFVFLQKGYLTYLFIQLSLKIFAYHITQ